MRHPRIPLVTLGLAMALAFSGCGLGGIEMGMPSDLTPPPTPHDIMKGGYPKMPYLKGMKKPIAAKK